MKYVEYGISNSNMRSSSFYSCLLDIRYAILIKLKHGLSYLICLIILSYPVYAYAMDGHFVKRVVDGDTLLLDDNRSVRYIGINAPEVQHGNTQAEPFGNEARNLNTRLVGGRKKVYLVYGREKSDRFSRELAYVYTHDKKFINRMMLEQGWAYYLFKRPNLRYHDIFLNAQRHAMQGRVGMWRNWEAPVLTLAANKRSRRFHRQDCPFGLIIGRSNKIFYYRLWDAFWEGYAPCKKCFPRGPFDLRGD